MGDQCIIVSSKDQSFVDLLTKLLKDCGISTIIDTSYLTDPSFFESLIFDLIIVDFTSYDSFDRNIITKYASSIVAIIDDSIILKQSQFCFVEKKPINVRSFINKILTQLGLADSFQDFMNELDEKIRKLKKVTAQISLKSDSDKHTLNDIERRMDKLEQDNVEIKTNLKHMTSDLDKISNRWTYAKLFTYFASVLAIIGTLLGLYYGLINTLKNVGGN